MTLLVRVLRAVGGVDAVICRDPVIPQYYSTKFIRFFGTVYISYIRTLHSRFYWESGWPLGIEYGGHLHYMYYVLLTCSYHEMSLAI